TAPRLRLRRRHHPRALTSPRTTTPHDGSGTSRSGARPARGDRATPMHVGALLVGGRGRHAPPSMHVGALLVGGRGRHAPPSMHVGALLVGGRGRHAPPSTHVGALLVGGHGYPS